MQFSPNLFSNSSVIYGNVSSLHTLFCDFYDCRLIERVSSFVRTTQAVQGGKSKWDVERLGNNSRFAFDLINLFFFFLTCFSSVCSEIMTK